MKSGNLPRVASFIFVSLPPHYIGPFTFLGRNSFWTFLEDVWGAFKKACLIGCTWQTCLEGSGPRQKVQIIMNYNLQTSQIRLDIK